MDTEAQNRRKRESYERLIEEVMGKIIGAEQDFEKSGGEPDELVDRALRSLGHAVVELEGLGREPTPICPDHNWPMELMRGPKGLFWSCHQKNEDGSWCDYKPAD